MVFVDDDELSWFPVTKALSKKKKVWGNYYWCRCVCWTMHLLRSHLVKVVDWSSFVHHSYIEVIWIWPYTPMNTLMDSNVHLEHHLLMKLLQSLSHMHMLLAALCLLKLVADLISPMPWIYSKAITYSLHSCLMYQVLGWNHLLGFAVFWRSGN